MKPAYPLTVFYDASCPVCALEMEHLRERDGAGRLCLIDMSAPDFDAERHGFTAADLDAQIHAVTADGAVSRGMAALRHAYAAAGLGWLLRPTGLAPLAPGFDWAYRVFARHRRAISRRLAPAIGALRRLREPEAS